MSMMQVNKGILKPVDIYEMCASMGLSYDDEDHMRELLMCDDLAVEIDGQWYSIDWEIRDADLCESFATVHRLDNGDISFHTNSLSGYSHWTELVAEELEA